MRQTLRCMFLLAVLLCAGWVHAQTTPLPPGTSLPDADITSPASASTRASALITKAENNIVHGEYDKALSFLNDAISTAPATSPEAARALYDRGYVEQEQQTAAAEEDFRKANTANPKQFESHAALGRLLAQQEKWKDAQHELALAAALPPASGDRVQAVADVDRSLAQVDAQLHDDAAASDALLAALKLTPEQTDDTLLAAQLAEDQNNYAGAEQEYKKALAADPKSIPSAEGLARTLIHESKFADAEPVLQQVLQQEPNDPVLLAQSAMALAGQGKTQDAITQLETLHRQNPNQPAVTRMLADLYSTGGQAANAEPLYQQLLSSDSQNADLLTAAGENFMREQKWPQAAHTFQQSLDLRPDQEDAWSGLAFAASENQQYPLVLTALDRRAQYLADGPATLFLRATALDHLHRTKEAIPYYRKFLSEAQGKFPDEESQTRERLTELQKSH
jgi:tetratricopeptide (TPR) repeat protein